MSHIENYLSLLILLLFCFIVSSWEKHKEGTFLTPFGALAWPYAIVVSMINLGGIYVGFFSVNLKSILFVITCLFFFLIGGMVIITIINNDTTKYFPESKNSRNEKFEFYRPLFIGLAIVSIVVGYIHFYLTINKVGWAFIATKSFEDIFGKGILAHITKLSRPAFIFLFADYLHRKNKSILILLILMLLLILVLQVKNNIITILLSGIYFGYMFQMMKVNFKKILSYISVVYIFFNLSYVIGYSRIGVIHAFSSKIQFYLFNHFFTYLFGGPIGFSEILSNSTYPLYSFKEVFAVPINLYNAVTHNPNLIDTIFHHWVPVSSIYSFFHSSNVFGIFGMLYMYMGSFATFIYMFLLGSAAYLIKFLAYKQNAFIGIQLVYVFVMSYLTISFFGLYFNLLPIYEVTFFMMVIPSGYCFIQRSIKRLRISCNHP